MTDTRDDDRLNQHLWDPTAPPAPEVTAIEAQLRPLAWRAPPPGSIVWRSARPWRGRRAWWIGLAAAAVLVVIAGTALWHWRLSWPDGRAWPILAATAAAPSELRVGTPLEIAKGDRAEVAIARIGRMALLDDSRMTLELTGSGRHRVRLDHGTVRVRTWAPPGSFGIHTPMGDVIDLGCEFDLTVGADHLSVQVRSGWVQLDTLIDEALIPAGASSQLTRNRAPGVPVYDDASSAFAAAVRRLEAGDGEPAADVRAIVDTARPRDVLTLLMLIDRGAAGREALAGRAAELWPPPADVTVASVLRGNSDAFWRWYGTLPLPSPKKWVHNWRDGLPAWLGGGLR